MSYLISIVETAMTENGRRVAFAAGVERATGRSFSVSFDPYQPAETPPTIHILPDIPQVTDDPPLPGWCTFIKTLTGDGDYLCDPPFPVEKLERGLIHEGLSDWYRDNVL